MPGTEPLDDFSSEDQDFVIPTQEYQREVLQYPMRAHQQIQDADMELAEIQVPHDDVDITISSVDIHEEISKADPVQQSEISPGCSLNPTSNTQKTGDDENNCTIRQIDPCWPERYFLELFSGKKHRFSSHIRNLGIKTLQPFDILLDSTMNILNNDIYNVLLRLVANKQVGSIVAAPPCTEYSMLKLQQPGPLPSRSPQCMDHPLFDTEECLYRFHSSKEIICRTVRILELQHVHGGYSALEQPLSAMSWEEPVIQEHVHHFSLRLRLSAIVELQMTINYP